MKKITLLVFAIITSISLFSQDQGITGETHRNNIGKILWANERIALNKQDQVQYQTKFDVSEPLYGRIFLEKSLFRSSEGQERDCINNYAYFKLKVYVDDNDMGFLNDSYFPGGHSWTTAQINLNLTPGDKADNVNGGVPEKWKKLVNGLDNGEHRIDFVFFGGEQDKCLLQLAKGSFILNKSGEMTEGKLSELPKALKKDAALENEMINAIKKEGWTNEYPVKVVIIENDWRIIKNPFGIIIRKEINTNVVLKQNDGTCRLTDISFERPFQGNNRYGATKVYGIGLKNIPFDCNAVK